MNMFGFVGICLTAYSSIAFISSCQPWSVYVWPWATKGGTPARLLASDAVSTCLSGSIIFIVAVVLSSHLDISVWHGLGCQTPSKPPLSAEGLRRSGSLCPCLQQSPVSSHVTSGSRPSHQRTPTSSAIGNLWPSLRIGRVFSIKSWPLLLASQSPSRIPLCQPPD